MRPVSYFHLLWTAIAVLAVTPISAQVSENLLENGSFDDGTSEDGVPLGWSLYMARDDNRDIRLVEMPHEGRFAVLIYDNDPGQEIGIVQTIPARGGECYEASVMVRGYEGASSAGSYLQLRFLPSDQFHQVPLVVQSSESYSRIAVKAVAPEGTKQARLYLYTHRDPAPKVMVDSVAIVSGVEPPPPPPPPVPPAVPPVYSTLKKLYLETPLVEDGQSVCSIVTPANGRYDGMAGRIQQTIADITGVRPAILRDTDDGAAVPIRGNLIALGNRSTNRTIEELYNRYYCLLDLRYPGPGGHVVRTLHNPFGDGHNVIFAGGSDDQGVSSAVDQLITRLREAGGEQGALTVGRIMDIKLGRGVDPPTDVRQMEIWDASRGYGSTGYFGWCSISKQAAMYYMTGRPEHAREFIRLSFPDEKAKAEIADIDGERIENKDDPLAGFYHYNAHLAILFWDLIEESDVFSDEERLRVTNAFSRQLNHRKDEGVYTLNEPPPYVGSRHGQWSAISLYCLGRYFQKDYPSPVWAQCVRGAELHFAPLAQHAWVQGESDNLFWYNTGTAPILTWMCLSGDRKPLESGALATLLRGQEILISGREPDDALNSAAIDYLHKAAYLMRDGRWIHYRMRTGIDTTIFRLGQSFWPEPELRPVAPTDLAGKWLVHSLPQPAWESRATGFSPDESYYFAGFRTASDDTGDYLLIDGFNGASRNPYHTLAILELRLDGNTLLEGYNNQLLTRADGLVEPQVAMDAALRWRDVIGQTAAFVADVPKAAYCNWRRGFAQRVGRYVLVMDDLTFRADSDNVEVQTLWETGRGVWKQDENALMIHPITASALPPGWTRFRARDAKYTGKPAAPDGIVSLDSLDIVLLRSREIGDWMEVVFEVPEPVSGEVFAEFLDYNDRGVAGIYLDGKRVVERYDNNAGNAVNGRVSLGRHTLTVGKHTVRLEVVGIKEGSDRAFIGFRGITVRPEGAPEPPEYQDFELAPSDPVIATQQGRTTTLEWTGKAREGEHRIFFTLIARPEAEGSQVSCMRLSDNAAALRLPQPAVAFTGEFRGSKAQFAVLAADHVFARAMTSLAAGALTVAISDVPVDLDWDFSGGALSIVAAAPASVRIAAAPAEGAMLNGQPLAAVSVPDGLILDLPAGRHTLMGVALSGSANAPLSAHLESLLNAAAESRTQALAARKAGAASDLPSLEPGYSAAVDGAAALQVTIPGDEGNLLAVAAGKSVAVLDSTGQTVTTLILADQVLSLHWWPEPALLLVGCRDERVVAFDRNWQRKWEFTSIMDPEVFRAAKTYWFKSAPGHEGVHAITSGAFENGKQQAFLGSACTLEIIDENGKLDHRMPVFWGPGHLFAFVDGPEGSTNLLIAREPTDSERLAIVNSRTPDRVSGWGFTSVPAGHVYVGSWAQMTRDHIFYVDMDGDGKREVVSEINGVWNRVTIWDGAGNALFNANFGPGNSIPARNIRDLDVADLDGDGKQEILVALSSGLVVALNHRCEKLWSTRSPSPPTVLAAFGASDGVPGTIFVGCENGSTRVLDAAGSAQMQGKVDGRPVSILKAGAGRERAVTVGTSKGQVARFQW
ncbi:MAG: VCBS repeat-containing protein [Armatimonadetes bacterium]|nr:VCBS repeat-containing protein [Armatimonadota bacterium]